MPFYLRPSAPTAADALICGDPARALAIAQHVLVQPRMSNHNRGLWGYHGETPAAPADGPGDRDRRPERGGGPHRAIELGVRRLIRVGTCARGSGQAPRSAPPSSRRATAADGTSRLLGAGAR